MKFFDVLKDPILHLAVIAVLLAYLGLSVKRLDNSTPIKTVAAAQW